MPKQKDLKRLIRARMDKTGESYTTARVHVLARRSVTPPVEEFAELAGMSDGAVEAKTGKDWPEWVRTLDELDAIMLSHREIARLVHETFEISGWWAQTVTVGYERIRGLRQVGQRRSSGKFEANKSKTYPVPVSRLYAAWADESLRERWLPGIELTVRTATKDKSMRITWPDGTSLHLYFTDKGPEKSAVAVQHVELASQEEMDERKEYWAERLARLGKAL